MTNTLPNYDEYTSCITDLPEEIIIKLILKYCDFKTYYNISKVCKSLRETLITTQLKNKYNLQLDERYNITNNNTNGDNIDINSDNDDINSNSKIENKTKGIHLHMNMIIINLLEYGYVEFIPPKKIYDILMLLISNNKQCLTKRLLSHSHIRQALIMNNYAPLCLATYTGQLEVLMVMSKYVNIYDECQGMLLEYAPMSIRARGDIEVIKFLLMCSVKANYGEDDYINEIIDSKIMDKKYLDNIIYEKLWHNCFANNTDTDNLMPNNVSASMCKYHPGLICIDCKTFDFRIMCDMFGIKFNPEMAQRTINEVECKAGCIIPGKMLTCALRWGHYDIVRLMINTPQFINNLVITLEGMIRTAISFNHYTIAKLLLYNNQLFEMLSKKNTALYKYCNKDYLLQKYESKIRIK